MKQLLFDFYYCQLTNKNNKSRTNKNNISQTNRNNNNYIFISKFISKLIV